MIVIDDTNSPHPTPVPPLVPAAQYIRMSTEHQQYSTANQADAIVRYATQRGFALASVDTQNRQLIDTSKPTIN
jgi:hypothetical protein